MREISTEKVKIGEHFIVDGVEYMAEEGSCNSCEVNYTSTCNLAFLCPVGGQLTRIKKKPVYRPYKDTDEMVEDWKERFMVDEIADFCMPMIWVKIRTLKSLITEYLNDSVSVNGMIYSVGALFVECTYLDGSPCGKVEE